MFSDEKDGVYDGESEFVFESEFNWVKSSLNMASSSNLSCISTSELELTFELFVLVALLVLVVFHIIVLLFLLIVFLFHNPSFSEFSTSIDLRQLLSCGLKGKLSSFFASFSFFLLDYFFFTSFLGSVLFACFVLPISLLDADLEIYFLFLIHFVQCIPKRIVLTVSRSIFFK